MGKTLAATHQVVGRSNIEVTRGQKGQFMAPLLYVLHWMLESNFLKFLWQVNIGHTLTVNYNLVVCKHCL